MRKFREQQHRRAAATKSFAGGVLVATVLVAGVLVAALGGLFNLGATAPAAPPTAVEVVRTPDVIRALPPAPVSPEVEFTVITAGDTLTHMGVNASARTSGELDFVPLMEGINPFVQGADLALCHLEVPVAPAGTALSGYPMFNGAPELIRDLQRSGWHGCSLASNHTVDRGFTGLESTINYLEDHGMGWAGSARTAAESEVTQMYVLEKENRSVTVAHLSATYGLNGLPVPQGKPWSVELIDTDRLIAQANTARQAGADIVLASIHCCVEYVTEPTAEQVALATTLAESGVIDAVIGHHAHVPQRVEVLPGGPQGHGMPVAYGLGNFLSNQDANCCVAATESGQMATYSILVDDDGPRVTGIEWTAITTDTRNHHLYPLATNPDGVGYLSSAQVAARYARAQEAATDSVPERTEPGTNGSATVTVLPRS